MRGAFLFFLFFPTVLFAQPDLLKKWQEKYPDRNAIFLYFHENWEIRIKGDSIETIKNVDQEILYLNDNAHLLNNGKVHDSYFERLEEIQAQTLVPVNKGYKTIRVQSFSDQAETSEGIFFDDYKSKTFVYPSLGEGARSQLKFRKRLTKPQIMPSFFFETGIPVIESKLVIKVDKRVRLKKIPMNLENREVKFTAELSGKDSVFTWVMYNVDDHDSESDAAPYLYYAPHLVIYIQEFQNSKKEWIPVLKDLSYLYKWNYTFIKNIVNEKDPMLKVLTDSIIKDLKTPEEKASALYAWVQDKVKYIAFEDGMRGLIPNKPSLVCSNRYGDCKDMASLLADMLKLAGLDAHLTWIGTREIPYKYTELPTPQVDNHMIVHLNLSDTSYFLDATDDYAQFGFPSKMIQGKEALIAIDSVNYLVKTVPIIPKELNQIIDSISFTIKDSRVIGNSVLRLYGYTKSYYAAMLSGLKKEDRDTRLNEMLNKGNNKFRSSDFVVGDLSNNSESLQIKYNFVIEDYVKSTNDEMYININLEKPYYNSFIDTARIKLPRENDHHYISTIYNSFEVPAGFDIEYLPSESEFNNSLFGFKFTIKGEGKMIYTSLRLYENYLIMDPEDFSQWNQMIKKLNQVYKDSIILKVKK